MNSLLNIFPEPQKIREKSGFFKLEERITCQVLEKDFVETVDMFHAPISLIHSKPNEYPSLIIKKKSLNLDEAYSLQVNRSQIILETGHKVGVFRGLQTLSKILASQSHISEIPCVDIEDSPLIANRGFMLDVSRCQVPTIESIFKLIDLLAKIGYNQLQLYVEHTFAFRNHEKVWENASPLTAQELKQIDDYCRKRFIDLVPNLNSFGHFERWLQHPEYHYLAECPNGFKREIPFMVKDHGTTLKPNQESLHFIDNLYEEYLPNFTSLKFNVGMDEPWELGQGWSASLVRTKGKEKVYLEYLEGILRLVEKHGRKMMFWADVLLEKPENAKLLPKSASPVIWGYEADHPFAEQAKTISSCGLSFMLAPGTSTWRSFSGRWHNARANIANATLNATRYGAKGILLTSWGDCGNHQPWPCKYPAIFLAAQRMWNGNDAKDEKIAKFINQMIYNSFDRNPAKILIDLANLDRIIGSKIPNASLTWNILFSSQPEKIPSFLKNNHSLESLKDGIDHLKYLSSALQNSKPYGDDAFSEQVSLGIDLSMIALEKGRSILGVSSSQNYKTGEIIDRFESNWLKNARTGGLQESRSLLQRALVSL